MISLAQIKAARALLNWTQDTLAKAAGLSLPGINNLERGVSSPRRETLNAIETALTTAGIEFIDTSGVRLKTPDLAIETIEGPDWIATYDQDIMSVMQGPDDELIQFSCDERLWIIYSGTTNHHYIEHRAKTGFKERIIIPDRADFITSPATAYRTLPADYFARANWQVYGDRVAQILWDSRKIILIKSAPLAESFRAQFEYLWASAKPLTSTHLNTIERWNSQS